MSTTTLPREQLTAEEEEALTNSRESSTSRNSTGDTTKREVNPSNDYDYDLLRSEQEGFGLSNNDTEEDDEEFEPFIIGDDNQMQATDEDGADEKNMGRTIEENIEVEVPISTAYNQWTLFEEFPKFIDSIESIIQVDDTTLLWQVDFGRVEEKFKVTITEQKPDQKISWKSLEGKKHVGSISFEPLELEKTRLDVKLSWEPASFLEKAGATFNIDKNEVKKALVNFKEFIENKSSEEGAWRGEVVDDDSSMSIDSDERQTASR